MKITSACGSTLLVILIFSVNESTVIEGPSNVTYLPNLTPLPIELTCIVTGTVLWRVNNVSYSTGQLTNGELPGHSRNGTNILVNSPVNNTEYICVSTTNDGDVNSDPAYVIIAGVPAMVPNVRFDEMDDITIDGRSLNCTLSWDEPFNNLDPIMNYIVSCLGDAACSQNSDITDTRRYNLTNLTTMANYTFSVAAMNSIGSGEAGIMMINTPGIGQPNITMFTCTPVDLDNQCTVTWEPVTQGNITEYQVYYNGTTKNVTKSTTTLTFTAPPLPNGVFSDNIVVMVTAVSNIGMGLASEPATVIINASSLTNTATALISPNVTSKIYNITVTCIIHPDSKADQCVVMAMADGRRTRTGTAPITNGMATVTVNGLECGVTYTITVGGTLNGDLVGPRSFHENVTAGLCPKNEDGNEDGNGNGDDNYLIIVLGVIIGIGGLSGATGTAGLVTWLQKRKKSSKKTDSKSYKENMRPTSPKITPSKNEDEDAQTSKPAPSKNEDEDAQTSKPVPSKNEDEDAQTSKPAQQQQQQAKQKNEGPTEMYAQVSKPPKQQQQEAKQKEGVINYADLDKIQKGSKRLGDADHGVQYSKVAETKH